MLRYPPAPAQGDDPENLPDDGVDLGQLWSTLRERWRFILMVGAVIFAATLFMTLRAGMTFKSSGRLYLGDLELLAKAGGQSGDLDISGTAQGDVGSEIEILKSQTLVSRAISDSGLNVTVTPRGWKRPRLWQWLAANRDPRILDIPTRRLIVVDATLADNSRGAQSYAVDFSSDHEYTLRSTETQAVLGRGVLGRPLKLASVTLTLKAGFDGHPKQDEHYDVLVRPIDATTDQVLGALVVTPAKGVGAEAAKVVSLEFSDGSAYFAATFLRTLMNGYLGERQAWKTEDATAAESFVTDQLTSLRDSLERSEQKLADYRSNTRTVVLDNEASAMIAQVGKYEEQRVEARLQVAALSDIKRVLKSPNPPAEAFLLGEANDTVLAGLATTLTEARQQQSDFEQQFGFAAPQSRQAQGQVEAQLQTIRNYVSSRLTRAQENLTSLNQIIGQFEEKLKTVPGAELGLAQLGRESEVYSRVYSYMLERQQQAAIIKASTVSKNRILDFPQIPYQEDSPKIALRMASAPLGLLIGAILVLMYRVFASSFQSQNEIRKCLAGLPIYATIPLRQSSGTPVIPDGDAKSTLDVLAGAPNSPFIEAFRTLRTNLYQSSEDGDCIVTLLTSPCPGDGKTTCVLSLAEILAADKKRVLVVDADLRKPSHHDLTGQPAGQGLRGILSGQCDWREAVRNVRFTFGRFDSIGTGKLAPAELISSERMHRFLQDVREHYDFVLIDSASFPLVSDALVLATVADCVLSVLRVRNSPRRLSGEHVRRLSSAAVNYGAIVIDTNVAGNPYPLVRREPLLSRLFDRLMRPRSRRTRKIIRAWSVGCAAVIAAAGYMVISRETARIRGDVTPQPAVLAPAAAPRVPATPAARTAMSPATRTTTKPAAPAATAAGVRVPATTAAAPVPQAAQVPAAAARAASPAVAPPVVPAAAAPRANPATTSPRALDRVEAVREAAAATPKAPARKQPAAAGQAARHNDEAKDHGAEAPRSEPSEDPPRPREPGVFLPTNPY